MHGSDPTALFGGIIGVVLLFYIGLIAVVLAGTIFWIVELIDVARRQFYDPNMKVVWVLVIVFTHFVGGLIYYFVGKSQGYLPGEWPMQGPPGSNWPPPPGPPPVQY